MALTDIAAGQDSGTNGLAPDNENENSEPTPKAVIELTIGDDGSFEVELETGDQEQAEEQGGGESAGATPVQAKDLAEALKIIEQMVNSVIQSPKDQATQAKSDQTVGYQQS